jgi:hypothetical protein
VLKDLREVKELKVIIQLGQQVHKGDKVIKVIRVLLR